MLTRDRNFYKQIARLTGFIALQNVIACLVGLVDNVMIGAYSQDALSGVSLANQVQFFLQMLAGGIGDGLAVFAAQYWGRQQIEPVRRVTAIALDLSIVLSLLFAFLARFAPTGILSLLTSDAAAIAEGTEYLRVICFSYVFFGVSMVLLAGQRSIENVSVGMVASLCGLVVNICLNWVLIFGHLGAPRMGVRGAAIATLVARIVEFGVCVYYTYHIDRKLALSLEALRKPDRGLLRDYRKIGVPVIMASTSWAIAMTVQTAVLGHLGSNAIAANSISNSLFQVITVIAYGMANASAVVIGKIVGGDDRRKLKEYVNTLQTMYVVIGVLSGLALYLCKDWILSLYAVSDDALGMAESFMLVLSITVVGTAYQNPCLTGIVRGGGNTKFVFYNDLIFMWGIVLPASLLAAFVFHCDPVIVFCCLKADQILKCFVAMWQVNSYHWVKNVTRADAADEASAPAA